MMSRLWSPLVVAALLSIACSSQKPEPQYASSASLSGYAAEYPQQLDASMTAYGTGKDELGTISGRLGDYDGKLKDPKSAAVALDVIAKADSSGKSYAYVERSRELEGTNAFFDEESGPIGQKVGGAAQYAAKQKSCDVDVAGPASGALKPAVAKQVEKRIRARNEAFVVIDRQRNVLPKGDIDVLEKLADDVARASYLANVAIPEQKAKIRRIAAEGDQVKKTADDFIAQEKAFQAEPGRTDADKKASDARIDAANKSKAQVDGTVAKAKNADKDNALDKDVEAAQKSYNESLDALKKKLSARKA